MKVLFLTNVPSPYRVDFFNELGKYCDLTVAFEKKTSDERDESWKNYNFKTFKGVFLRGISIAPDSALCFGVGRIIKKGEFDAIICANFSSPTGMMAIQYMRRHKIPYWLESDGGFAKSGKGIKEAIKKYFIRGAKGYFSTSEAHDQYYLAYGAESKRIYRYPFTSLCEKDIALRPLLNEERGKLRQELGMSEPQIVLAVGQFIPRKGFDLLLRAVHGLGDEIGVYFVGGAPTDEYLNIRNQLALYNVHFEGFKNKDELKKYYQAADVFVLPTREDIWGLVINEAMSNGLPIITTNKCIAGLELVGEENGMLIQIENIAELQEGIQFVLNDEKVRSSMGWKSLDIIREYTIEKMAKRHLQILNGQI